MKLRNELGQFTNERQHKPWSLDNFNDGYVDSDGRFRVILPNHPRASRDGFVLRSIVAYEIYHNIQVKLGPEIHHMDGNRLNDSKENLQLLTNSDHQKTHARLRGAYISRVCNHCGKAFEINRWRLKEPTRGQYCTPRCFYNSRKIYKNIPNLRGNV